LKIFTLIDNDLIDRLLCGREIRTLSEILPVQFLLFAVRLVLD